MKYKVVLVGSSGAGKTSLSKCWSNQESTINDANHVSTIGVEFITVAVPATANEPSNQVAIWDTAGQERFASLVGSYTRAMNALVVVFDVTNRDSYSSAQGYVQRFKERAQLVVLVANKIDQESTRVIDQKTAKNYATEADIAYMETSIKHPEAVRKKLSELTVQMKERLTPQAIADYKKEQDANFMTAFRMHYNALYYQKYFFRRWPFSWMARNINSRDLNPETVRTYAKNDKDSRTAIALRMTCKDLGIAEDAQISEQFSEQSSVVRSNVR